MADFSANSSDTNWPAFYGMFGLPAENPVAAALFAPTPATQSYGLGMQRANGGVLNPAPAVAAPVKAPVAQSLGPAYGKNQMPDAWPASVPDQYAGIMSRVGTPFTNPLLEKAGSPLPAKGVGFGYAENKNNVRLVATEPGLEVAGDNPAVAAINRSIMVPRIDPSYAAGKIKGAANAGWRSAYRDPGTPGLTEVDWSQADTGMPGTPRNQNGPMLKGSPPAAQIAAGKTANQPGSVLNGLLKLFAPSAYFQQHPPAATNMKTISGGVSNFAHGASGLTGVGDASSGGGFGFGQNPDGTWFELSH